MVEHLDNIKRMLGNNSIILDIGLAFTKAGFAQDSVPKHIIPTPLKLVESFRASIQDLKMNTFAQLFEDKKKVYR